MGQELLTLKEYLNTSKITTGLEKLLGKKTESFKTNLNLICQNNSLLQRCEPSSILGAAVCATVNNLSLTPSLGQAYIVPYGRQASFLVGFKGLIQLAHRTGQYRTLHAGKVYEGEFSGINPFTGEPERGEKISDKVVGYVAYMRLINGFEKYLYMTIEELTAHAEKYSQSYAYDKRTGKKSSPWSTNFDAMATKTVLKLLINRWGILSAEMADVINADQSVVSRKYYHYVDNGGNCQNREGVYTAADDVIDVTDILEEVPAEGTDAEPAEAEQ